MFDNLIKLLATKGGFNSNSHPWKITISHFGDIIIYIIIKLLYNYYTCISVRFLCKSMSNKARTVSEGLSTQK